MNRCNVSAANSLKNAPVAARSETYRAFNLAPLPKAFHENAGSYSDFAVVQRQLAAWLAEWLEPNAHTTGLSALEFGAGDGMFTQYLVPRFHRITAIDIAPRMTEEGRRRLPAVTWQVEDAWRTNYRCVDRLYSSSFLHLCVDPAPVLRRWRRLIKAGGRMLHGMYVAPSLAEWETIMGGCSIVAWRSPTQWLSLLRDAGWKVLRGESQTHTEHFASALDFVRFLHHTGATARCLTPIADLRRMIADYQRRFTICEGTTAVTSTWTFFRVEVGNS